MPWYNAGTIQVAANGTTATGTGTAFIGNVRIGDAITIAGSTALHEVTGVTSDTQLTFQPPYAGTAGSGKAYRVAPVLGYDKDLSDAFNQIRLNWGTQLSSLQPWATAATADIALSNLGGSAPGTAVFKGTAAAGRTALGLGNAATATVQTSPTDNTAGRLMAVGAFGLGVSNTPLVSNANDAITSGFFRMDGGTGGPLGGWSYGSLIVASRATSRISQLFVPLGGVEDDRFYIRSYSSENGWTPWRLIYSQRTILGTVSQSGGVPTGAIIERGSNANGRFTKYADGTVVMDNSGNAITTNPVTTVGAVTSVDSNKLRYGFWF